MSAAGEEKKNAVTTLNQAGDAGQLDEEHKIDLNEINE